jgi:hypothetical protein
LRVVVEFVCVVVSVISHLKVLSQIFPCTCSWSI